MLGIMTIGFVLAGAVPTQAQAPDADLARIRTALFKEVRITDGRGVQRSGVLTAVKGDTLQMVASDGPFTASIASSARIERRGDSVLNGMLVGGAVGIFFLEVVSRAAGVEPGERLAIDLWGGSFYAFIGGAFDALHTGWTTLKGGRR